MKTDSEILEWAENHVYKMDRYSNDRGLWWELKAETDGGRHIEIWRPTLRQAIIAAMESRP